MDLGWFDHFPEPVFYIKSGRLSYLNAAAAALEPGWAAGMDVPEVLDLEPDEEGVFSCRLGEREFQAAVTRDADGLLLVLRNPVKTDLPGAPAFLPAQLREMLNSVQAVTHLLTPALREHDDGTAQRNLAALNQSFYRLLRLARHLELVQRAQDADDEVEELNLDLAVICREVCYGAAGLAEQAGVTFRQELPGGVMPSVGERELLEIMLLELISNAIKAARKGGEVGVRLVSNASRALITVWDNGPGMSQAELTGLMDGNSPDSLPRAGTGLRLGLPIARYAAAAHGGAVLLESPAGQGLRVTVSLPLKKQIKGKLRSPRPKMEETFSPLLTMLSDSLPWNAFDEP